MRVRPLYESLMRPTKWWTMFVDSFHLSTYHRNSMKYYRDAYDLIDEMIQQQQCWSHERLYLWRLVMVKCVE